MIIKGHGVLFDPKKGKAAARFVNGELDTDDKRIIELATMAGFVDTNNGTFSGQETPVEDDEEIDGETGELMHEVDGDYLESEEWNPTKDELLEIAERHGVEVDKRWGVERLKEAVL